jgi:hypothetical protein
VIPATMAAMKDAAELAGFFAAHAVWCVSDGGPLVPLAGYLAGGQRQAIRFADGELESAVAGGKEWLASNRDGADIAVLVYDGYITLPGGKTDALIVEARSFREPAGALTMAVPYRNREHPSGFAVYRPKFLDFSSAVKPDYAALGDAFFAGVDGHEHGSAVWNKHLDQSQ